MVLDYLKVLIWPATTLAIVYGFRGQFRDLIHRVRVLSGPGIDAEFSERVLEASEGAEAAVLSHPPGDAPEDSEPSGPSTSEASDVPSQEATDRSQHHVVRGHYRTVPDEDDALILLAESHPGAAVVAAFIGVESELRRLGETELPTARRLLSTRQLAEALPLPQDIKNSVVEMNQLRNGAAHGQQVVSTRAARAFVRSSRELIDWLEAFGDQPRLF
ncbi:hypothetical protein ACIGW7_30995 [Streptomyces sp. NPDC053253]|uniref:hypothetical protein n=1 Tax=Streptomyces sp. NPDC053253 TaxID=3365699 RepID=UPI0037D5D53E